MSDVFISYSRSDIDFVRHLFDQLKARDREAWVDWQAIPPTADWLAEFIVASKRLVPLCLLAVLFP